MNTSAVRHIVEASAKGVVASILGRCHSFSSNSCLNNLHRLCRHVYSFLFLLFSLFISLPLFSARCGGPGIVFDAGYSSSPEVDQIPRDKNKQYQPQMAIAKIPLKRVVALYHVRDEKLT